MADPMGRTAVRTVSLADAGDFILGVGVVAILGVMIIPLPTSLLDFLLTFNITLAIVVLLTAMYTLKPLEFSVFPSLLLIVTLFRL
ncbi:MAG: FHIPEP family type III secretion protein, partial [Candidatus Adiutricales bacterium]